MLDKYQPLTVRVKTLPINRSLALKVAFELLSQYQFVIDYATQFNGFQSISSPDWFLRTCLNCHLYLQSVKMCVIRFSFVPF